MALNDDLAEIKSLLYTLANTASEIEAIGEIRDKLKYDIEPKLDKALEGNTTTEATPKRDPNELLRNIRYAIIYATTERKIEAIKELRKVTNAGLAEAKSTAEWITTWIAEQAAEQREKETF